MPSTARTERRRKNNLKHLDLCFSNFINSFTHESPPTNPTATSSSHHHRQSLDHNRPSMIKNFNTLYDHTLMTATTFEPEPEPADLATAFASQRFFFSSPGRSNSIVESTNTDTDCTQPSSSSSSSLLSSSLTANAPPLARASTSTEGNNEKKSPFFLDGSVAAVPTYSSDPYVDFRQSMQEMVEARPELVVDVKSNWHVLHELLLCYLALNPKSAHKFIFGAFSDLLATLMSFSSSSSSQPPPPPPPQNPYTEGVAGGGGGC